MAIWMVYHAYSSMQAYIQHTEKLQHKYSYIASKCDELSLAVTDILQAIYRFVLTTIEQIHSSAPCQKNSSALHRFAILAHTFWLMLHTYVCFFAVGSQRPLLPNAEKNSFIACPHYSSSSLCFLAGDLRANEQSSLSVLHTLWLREHNRIAQYLKDNNEWFSSEKIFQMARAIVVAEMQKIYIQRLSSHTARR